ncbi:MAG TPA: hypothetical protein VFQ45_05410 [Longimicrobium sp.]|nr:hypothetical protein [Longimicrobium sp.]
MSPVVTVIVLLAATVAYAGLCALQYRHAGVRGLVLVWLAASAVWGYLKLGWWCGRPLTCDVGSPAGVITYYETHYLPVFVAMSLLWLGVGAIVVWRRERRAAARASLARTVGAATAATVGAWLVVSLLAYEVLQLPN